MKRKHARVCILSLIVFILTSSFIPQTYPNINSKIDKHVNLSLEALILIDSDDDFISYGFPGNGTQIAPYKIEAYNIETTTGSGIILANTTKYVVIQSCIIDAEEYGILIDSVEKGRITLYNNTIMNHKNSGVEIINSHGLNISHNICKNNFEHGISIRESNNTHINNNICYGNWRGISLSFGYESIVVANNCSNNDIGIYAGSSDYSYYLNNSCTENLYSGTGLWFSCYSTIIDNKYFNNRRDGLLIFHSEESKVENNSFIQDGLDIREETTDAYSSYIVSNNTVNGKPLGFFINLKGTTITEEHGQLILINCEKVEVMYQSINQTSYGITLIFCTSCTVKDNQISFSQKGILIKLSSSIHILNNFCSNNQYSGIHLIDSPMIEIRNNTCTNNTHSGIYLDDSTEAIIDSNFCSESIYGIWLGVADNSTITKNICSKNYFDGLFDWTSLFLSIYNNEFSMNGHNGLQMTYGSYFDIQSNLFSQNKEYGLKINGASWYNIIHHNNFTDNNLQGDSQAYDDGKETLWYDKKTKEGNYWSDWDGKGRYYIDGSANSKDPYPLDKNSNPFRTKVPYIAIPSSLLLVAMGVTFYVFVIRNKRKNNSLPKS